MTEHQGQKADTPVKQKLEFFAALVGAVLAFATLGVIVWDGLRDEDRPALITVRAEAVHQYEAGFVVEIVATNSGDATAAGLLIEGSLLKGGQAVETSETTFDYAPSLSKRHGGLIFQLNPAQYQLRLRAKGYAEP